MPDAKEGPWKVTAKDVVNGKVNYDTARKTTVQAFEELTAKSKPTVGDVLLTKDGTLGRCAVVEEDGICVNQSVAVLKCNEKILPKFLTILLQMPEYQREMLKNAGGGTIKHIYITKVVDMLIVVPTISQQMEFLSFVEQVDKSKYIEKILVRVLAIFGKKYIFGNRMNSVFMKIRDFYMNLLKKILLGAIVLVLCACGNPILGKWKATSGGELLASVGCGEVEFTSSKEYSCGMAQDVEYEIDGDKVLVKGALGVSVVYYMQGKNKMYMELLGDRVYWEKIK